MIPSLVSTSPALAPVPAKPRTNNAVHHVGADVMDYLQDRERRDPELAALVRAEHDKLRLAQQIRALRESHGLSQVQLAELLGTRQPYIARIESGRMLPRIDMLSRLAAVLGLALKIEFVPPGRE